MRKYVNFARLLAGCAVYLRIDIASLGNTPYFYDSRSLPGGINCISTIRDRFLAG
jgi:hypothetical protein